MVGYNIKRFIHPDDINMFMSQFFAPTDVSLQSAFSRIPQDNISTKLDHSKLQKKFIKFGKEFIFHFLVT
jgi:hypothetical protein